MQLRPYQLELLQRSKEHYEAGVTRQLLTLPTGMGKAVCLANMKSYIGTPGRSLVIVNREELASQAADKMAVWNPGMSIGIEMGGKKAIGHETIVAGIQTLAVSKSRLQRLNPSEFGLVIVDECHYSLAASYIKVFEHFGLLRDCENPSGALLAGYTATTGRGDGRPLGEVYDAVVYSYPIRRAIEEGWLVDIHGMRIRTSTDISGVGTSKGDFNTEQLSQAVNTPQRNELIVKTWIGVGWPRQTIAFCSNVEHAKALCAAFVRQGIAADAVWSGDPERESKIARLKNGTTDVLTNVSILCEGFDYWGVECIILAAPTKVQSRMQQQIGRGTRLQEGIGNLVDWNRAPLHLEPVKQGCLILDFVDNTGKHSLVSLASVFGLPNNLDLQGQSVTSAMRAVDEVMAKCPHADLSRVESFGELASLDYRIEEVSLWDVRLAKETTEFSTLTWVKGWDGSFLLRLPSNQAVRVTEDATGRFTVSGTVNKEPIQLPRFESLERAVGAIEKEIMARDPQALSFLGREERWRKGKASEGQIKMLERLRVPPHVWMTWDKGRVKDYLDSRFNKHS